MQDDDYGIYRRPSTATVVAVICSGAALFFGSWSMQLKNRLSAELQSAQEKTDKTASALSEKEQQLLTMNSRLIALQNEIRNLQEERARRTESHAVLPAPAAAVPAASAVPAAAVRPPAPRLPEPKADTQKKAEAASASETAVKLPDEDSAMPAPRVELKSSETEVPAAVSTTLDDANVLSGEILTYNPDNQRVYLSLGSANGGVEQGNRFTVWRGGEYVTDIEVLKVFSVTSTCKITGDAAAGLQVGDIARRSRPVLGSK